MKKSPLYWDEIQKKKIVSSSNICVEFLSNPIIEFILLSLTHPQQLFLFVGARLQLINLGKISMCWRESNSILIFCLNRWFIAYGLLQPPTISTTTLLPFLRHSLSPNPQAELRFGLYIRPIDMDKKCYKFYIPVVRMWHTTSNGWLYWDWLGMVNSRSPV